MGNGAEKEEVAVECEWERFSRGRMDDAGEREKWLETGSLGGGHCYGRNVPPTPKFRRWNPNVQGDGLGGVALGRC